MVAEQTESSCTKEARDSSGVIEAATKAPSCFRFTQRSCAAASFFIMARTQSYLVEHGLIRCITDRGSWPSRRARLDGASVSKLISCLDNDPTSDVH